MKAQRNKKRTRIKKSELDSIPGVGEVLKSRLLKKFKSIKNIKRALKEELMTVDGINERIAKLILKELK